MSTILVADDSRTIRQVVKMALKGSPHEVAEAESARQTKEKAAGGVELILLDYHLPDTPGVELCRELKSETETREIPIIMLEGDYHNTAPASEALEVGAEEVVPKPFETDQLLSAINDHLQQEVSLEHPNPEALNSSDEREDSEAADEADGGWQDRIRAQAEAAKGNGELEDIEELSPADVEPQSGEELDERTQAEKEEQMAPQEQAESEEKVAEQEQTEQNTVEEDSDEKQKLETDNLQAPPEEWAEDQEDWEPESDGDIESLDDVSVEPEEPGPLSAEEPVEEEVDIDDLGDDLLSSTDLQQKVSEMVEPRVSEQIEQRLPDYVDRAVSEKLETKMESYVEETLKPELQSLVEQKIKEILEEDVLPKVTGLIEKKLKKQVGGKLNKLEKNLAKNVKSIVHRELKKLLN